MKRLTLGFVPITLLCVAVGVVPAALRCQELMESTTQPSVKNAIFGWWIVLLLIIQLLSLIGAVAASFIALESTD